MEGMKIFENISLKPYNTFGIDVKARRMVVAESEADVARLPQLLDGPYMILGGGSDIVFTHDYDGTVVRLTGGAPVFRTPPLGIGVYGPAGMLLDDLVAWTVRYGIPGMENLSAIPGTVGAAVVQNVGAYGVEAKDIVEYVDVVDLATGRQYNYPNYECGFGYRTSRFKQGDGHELVTGVWFRLSQQDDFVPNLAYAALADEVRRRGLEHPTQRQMRDIVTELRWGKLPRPEEHGSAGSFFKNPVVDEATYQRLRAAWPDMPQAHPAGTARYKLSAGWLIDRAGWKGRTMGRAGVWPKQALVLYNTGGCTGAEVLSLARAIQQDVGDKFGVAIEPEAIII